MGRDDQQQRPVSAWLPTAVVALLLALVVIGTSSARTWELTRDPPLPLPPYPPKAGPPPQEFEERPPGEGTLEPVTSEGLEFSPVVGQVAVGLVVFLLVAAALLLLWLFVRYRRSRAPDADRDDLRITSDATSEGQTPVIMSTAARARHEVRAGTVPRDAIIKAWLALEEAAADSGVRRRPSDTPTDLTVTVLDRTAADPDATRGLLRLYHRARFGTAEMTVSDQERALTYLERLARDWDQVPP